MGADPIAACVKASRCRPITTGRQTLWPASESRHSNSQPQLPSSTHKRHR
jgi:hypothetical protein